MLICGHYDPFAALGITGGTSAPFFVTFTAIDLPAAQPTPAAIGRLADFSVY